ncbi:hypothetical protein SAMN05660862_0086 [Sphingobacterium psychroaquaticum]|uniref:Uncharacterized protein n=1 Tax=Sphingobacterium psychroaquaticum TaxID=561061 RepID=A0A1X7HVC9_9SPHI|nr:hypothetical protein SAMN05660862_0086 [Sphingobacterium psychroaquaticum]
MLSLSKHTIYFQKYYLSYGNASTDLLTADRLHMIASRSLFISVSFSLSFPIFGCTKL